MSKVMLYSGGLDSYIISKLWKPDIKLYINIHGDYSEQEVNRLPSDVKVVDFSLLGDFELPSKHVPMRNLYFLMIASHYGDEVCLGATAGDKGNKDKTALFLKQTESMLQYLWGDKKCKKDIKVNKEFIKYSKSELIEIYLNNGGDVNELKDKTFSCYTPIDNKECLNCFPCFRKFALLYAHGCQYSDEECLKMWEYIKKNIIPTASEGGYKGTYYTERGTESKDLIYTVDTLRNKYEN